MFGLIHHNPDWLLAGIIVVVGIIVFAVKFVRGHYMSTIISAAVWLFVFSMHKGSTQGIMTATFAALIFDLIGMPIIMLFSRKRTH